MNKFQQIAATLGASLLIGQAHAAPVLLSDLVSGAVPSISAGAFSFSGFRDTGLGGTVESSLGVPFPELSKITVDVLVVDPETVDLVFNTQSDPGAPQLTIDSGPTLYDFIDIPVSFQVDISGGLVSQSVGLELTDSTVVDNSLIELASATIYEQLFASDGGASISTLFQVRNDPLLGNITSHNEVVTGYTSFWVEKNAIVQTSIGDQAEIAEFRQRYSAVARVPAPAAILLMGLGLVAISRIRAVRRKG